MFRASVLGLCAVALAACATPNQQEAFIGGFNVTPLGQDVYRIRFGGNGYTTLETVQVYWLDRAAQVAIDNGFNGFEILSDMHFVLWRPDGDDGREPLRRAAAAAVAGIPMLASADELAAASAWRPTVPGAAGDQAAGRIRIAASTFVYIPGGGAQAPHPSLEGDIHLINRATESVPPKVFNARALHAMLEPLIISDTKCSFGNVCPHVHQYLLPKGALHQ
jgi:hypothetical protein